MSDTEVHFTNTKDIESDIFDMIKDISSLTDREISWFSRAYLNELRQRKEYVRDSNISEMIVKANVEYAPSDSMKEDAQLIVEWLSEVKNVSSGVYENLLTLSFDEALSYSKELNRTLKETAKESFRYIEENSEKTPKVLDLGNGWEVFNLKNIDSRYTEMSKMEHNIGDESFYDLTQNQAILSVRKHGVIYRTLHLRDDESLHYKEDYVRDIFKEYTKHLESQIAKHLGAKLTLGLPLDDTSALPDGWHDGVNGVRVHTKKGVIHNDSHAPAVIGADGSVFWYRNGLQHKDSGPAAFLVDGTMQYKSNGNIHRIDGPAAINSDGSLFWLQNDKLHRLDGPAIEFANGAKEWYQNGKLHRGDGPAVIDHNGREYYYLDGKHYSEYDFNMMPQINSTENTIEASSV